VYLHTYGDSINDNDSESTMATEKMVSMYDELACDVCKSEENEEKMLICDLCEKGYHLNCHVPNLESIPLEDWVCTSCKNLK